MALGLGPACSTLMIGNYCGSILLFKIFKKCILDYFETLTKDFIEKEKKNKLN